MWPLFVVLLIVLVLNVMQTGGSVTAAQKIAAAIAKAEGSGKPGAIPTIANNPGDLVEGDLGNGTIQGKTVFASAQEGLTALENMVSGWLTGNSRIYSPDMTISEISTWYVNGTADATAASDAWASNVANALGLSVNDPLSAVQGG